MVRRGDGSGNGQILTISDGTRHILDSGFKRLSDKLLKYRNMIADSEGGM